MLALTISDHTLVVAALVVAIVAGLVYVLNNVGHWRR